MTRLALIFSLAVGFLPGCRLIHPLASVPPSGAMPSVIVSDVDYPNEQQSAVTEIPYGSGRVEIIGWFETEEASGGLNARFPLAGSQDVIGVRDSDYQSTYRALLEANDLDGMVNVTIGTRRYVLNLLVLRGTLWETKVGGLGYRLKNE